jgi:hypothetical protein
MPGSTVSAWCKPILAAIPIDRMVAKPKVSIIGEFWAMTTEGDGNYQLQRFLESEGAEADIQLVTAWILYMIWEARRDTQERMNLGTGDNAKYGLGELGPFDVAKKLVGVAPRGSRRTWRSIASSAALPDARPSVAGPLAKHRRTASPGRWMRRRSEAVRLTQRSARLHGSTDQLLNVVRALTCSKLDNAKIGETELVKRVFLDDGLDLFPALAHSEDDASIPRYLSSRDQEIARGIILFQKGDVRAHVGVDLGEARFVGELDDEHGSP